MASMMLVVPLIVFIIGTVLANKTSFTQNQRTGTVTVCIILLVICCIISILGK